MHKPWMPFYVGDYLADTRHLTLEQHGAYLLLITHYWKHGSLPDDDAELRRIVGATVWQWKRIWPAVKLFFEASATLVASSENGSVKQLLGKCWRHKRLDKELERAEIISTKRQLAGQRGGLNRARRANPTKHFVQAIAKQMHTQPQSKNRKEESRFENGAAACALEGVGGAFPDTASNDQIARVSGQADGSGEQGKPGGASVELQAIVARWKAEL
jgi:uncharacterized protein YdaU (DUF1376 family)